MVVALTGPNGASGTAEAQSVKQAAALLNKTGGMNGHKISLKVANDNSDPATAASLLASELSGGNKPDLVYDGTSDPEAQAMLPALTKAHILSMSPLATTDDPKKWPYSFETSVSGGSFATFAKFYGQYMVSKGHKKVGLALADDAGGHGLMPSYVKGLKAAGITPVVEFYSDTAIDDTGVLEKLRSQGVDALMVEAFGPPAGYILKGVANTGWNVPVFGELAMMSNNLSDLVPAKDLKNVVLGVYPVMVYKAPKDRSPGLAGLIDGLKASGKTIPQPLDLYSLSYDVLPIVAMATKQANSTDTAKVVNALEHLKQPTGEKPYVTFPMEDFSPTEHALVESNYGIVQAGPLVDGMEMPISN